MSSLIIRVVRGLTLAGFLVAVPALAQSPNPQEPEHKVAQADDARQQDTIDADRPGIADGSNVVGARRFQIETGMQEEFRRDGDSREHTVFLPTLLRIGFDNHWEARIEGNTFTRIATSDPTGSSQTSGFAPISLGLKYHFYDSKGARPLSLGTIVRFFPAWGSGDFRAHHVTGDVRLAADWDFAPRLKLSLNPNVGVGRYEDDQGRTFSAGLFAVTLSYLPTRKLNPFVDCALQSPEGSNGKSSAIFDAGVAYIIGRNVQLDASIGTGARGNTPPHPFIGFGISFRSKTFGKKKP